MKRWSARRDGDKSRYFLWQRRLAGQIAGQNSAHPMTKTNIPGCTYSLPQIASIGLTEPPKHSGYSSAFR